MGPGRYKSQVREEFERFLYTRFLNTPDDNIMHMMTKLAKYRREFSGSNCP